MVCKLPIVKNYFKNCKLFVRPLFALVSGQVLREADECALRFTPCSHLSSGNALREADERVCCFYVGIYTHFSESYFFNKTTKLCIFNYLFFNTINAHHG